MVVVIDRRAGAAERRPRGREPALELVVVVAVEQIVLAVVLVVDHRVDRAEQALEALARRQPLGAAAVAVTAAGVAAPHQIGLGGGPRVPPAALPDHGLQAAPTGARPRPEAP